MPDDQPGPPTGAPDDRPSERPGPPPPPGDPTPTAPVQSRGNSSVSSSSAMGSLS